MLKRMVAVLVSLVAALGMIASPAAALGLGDPAPGLKNVKWHRGEPVPEYKPGEVYVLDFWATWCGPCIASIPHINGLQEKYKDQKVNVIGVAVWPRQNMRPIAPFVESRPDMNYRIAEDIDNNVAKAYMESTGQNGIPTVMVIDRQGRLAWIGHPMSGLDDVLERIVSGSFDIGAEKADRKRREEIQEKAMPLQARFSEAMRLRKWDELIKVADELMALDGTAFGQAGLYKYYVMLTQMKQPEQAAAWGRELVAGYYKNNPEALNSISWLIATNPDIADSERDLDLALAAAQAGCEQSKWQDASVIDTLARVHAMKGDFAKAAEQQAKAVALAKEDAERASYQKQLDNYRANRIND